MRVGIVCSRFNEEICARLLEGAQQELASLGVRDIAVERVPGALEIPLALQWMAQSRSYDALVAVGAVIRGDTYHFDLVCNESARGVMDVQLEYGLPVGNGILTTDTEEQALARADKGAEAVRAALEMVRLRAKLAERPR